MERDARMDRFVGALFGHAAFQQLNAAANLGLFEMLDRAGAAGPDEIAEALELPRRSVDVLLLGTAALGLVVKDGERYANAAMVAEMVADGTWEVLRPIIEFQAEISYVPASDFTEALRTGRNVGIRHFPGETDDLYTRLGNVPGLEALFYRCMNAWSALSNPVLLHGPDFSGVRHVLDIGGGDAVNAVALVQAHPHLHVTVLDRPGALAEARATIERSGVGDRVTTHAADIFTDPYPTGYDVYLFAHQLVIWTPEQNTELLGRAREAIGENGRVLVFNAFADDDGTGPLYSALDNVYFSTLPAQGSTIYRWCDHEEWLEKVGFTWHRRIANQSWTPHGVLEARVAQP